MTVATMYPKDWTFPNPADRRLGVGELIPAAVAPSPNPTDCPNCSGVSSVYAYKVVEKGGVLDTIGGHKYRLSLVSGSCPVCRGTALQDYLLAASGLAGLSIDGKPMAEIRLADVPPGPGQQEAFEVAWALLAEIPHPKTWALFSGAYGTGKTHLLAGLVNGCRLAGVRAVYTHSSQMLDEIRATFGDHPVRPTAQVVAEYVAPPALAVDEFDRIRWTEWAGSQIFSLLETRYQLGRATWFASNLGPSALEAVSESAAALVSRMSSGLMAVLTGPDRRPFGGLAQPASNGLPDRYVE